MVSRRCRIRNEDVLRAARKAFAVSGFHKAKIDEVAMIARISVGQIYRLFESKDEIVKAIICEDGERWILISQEVIVRLDSGVVGIEDALIKLLMINIERNNEDMSLEIMAEALRKCTSDDIIVSIFCRYRKILRKIASYANPFLSGQGLDVAEEWLLACVLGLGHRKISCSQYEAVNTARSIANATIVGLRAMS